MMAGGMTGSDLTPDAAATAPPWEYRCGCGYRFLLPSRLAEDRSLCRNCGEMVAGAPREYP